MRRYVLLLMLALVSCSRPDFDTSVQVEAWLRSLDPNAEVIEVWCKGNVEEPPLSGIWKEYAQTDRWTVKDVLAVYAKSGLDWSDIVAGAIDATKVYFPKWALTQVSVNQTPMDRMVRKINLQIENLRCDGKALRSPPIQIGKCPNSTDGCDEPPNPTDPPPLPPPPPPGGGGDF
jgi:hypothetical protein